MRIGEAKDYSDKEMAMYNNWENIYSGSPAKYPSDIFDFILHQCNRFGIQYPPEEFTHYVVDYVYTFCASWEPYILYYSNTSDVEYTDDWASYTYEIKTLDGAYEEADPQQLETFKINPGQDLDNFNHIMSHPGVEALERDLGICLREYLNGDMNGESVVSLLSPSTYAELKRIAGTEGNIDAYVDITAWAAFAWIIGPPGRDFRRDMNYIFDVCYSYGECIVYEGCIFSPQQYRVVKRPPQSCVICGLDAWCVEMVYIDGQTRYMCEHHVNSTPLSKFHCGTKFCKHTECPHHPTAGQGMKAIDFVRIVHGHQQNMVEWNSSRKPKELPTT